MEPLKSLERMEDALLDAAVFYSRIVAEMEHRQKAIHLGDGEKAVLVRAKFMRRRLMQDYTQVRLLRNW